MGYFPSCSTSVEQLMSLMKEVPMGEEKRLFSTLPFLVVSSNSQNPCIVDPSYPRLSVQLPLVCIKIAVQLPTSRQSTSTSNYSATIESIEEATTPVQSVKFTLFPSKESGRKSRYQRRNRRWTYRSGSHGMRHFDVGNNSYPRLVANSEKSCILNFL